MALQSTEPGGRVEPLRRPIPIEDVERRLFHWQAESRRLAMETPAELETMSHLSEDGQPMRWVVLEDRQAIARSDDSAGKAMGLFKSGYQMHQYREWLLTTVANILDDTLSIQLRRTTQGRGHRLGRSVCP